MADLLSGFSASLKQKMFFLQIDGEISLGCMDHLLYVQQHLVNPCLFIVSECITYSVAMHTVYFYTFYAAWPLKQSVSCLKKRKVCHVFRTVYVSK